MADHSHDSDDDDESVDGGEQEEPALEIGEFEVEHEVQLELIPQDVMDKLLPGEKVKHIRSDIRENSTEGVLFVTNFRVIFLNPTEKTIHNEFPNISIWKLKKGSKKENKKESTTLLHIRTKDGRMLKLKLASETQFKETFDVLTKYAYPPELNSLFAFTYKQYFIKDFAKGQDIRKYTNPELYDPLREYQRIGLPCAGYRITTANQDYKLCPTYPSVFIVPEGISDEQLKTIAGFRSRGRVPAVVWKHPVHGSTISRCSQPSVGLKGNSCTEDISFLSQLRASNQQALHILDSRPKTNALANSLKGGGYEKTSHYKDCHSVEFQNVENIHAVRNALLRIYKLCANKSPYNNKHWKSALADSKWLEFIRAILQSGVRMAEIVHKKGQSVLIHCSDGWDRTAQTCSIAQLLMDPFYRTIEGLIVLLEKEWLTFGHQFARRAGHGANITNPKDSQRSPIFLQFIDSLWQILQQFPNAFEFNGQLLIALMDNLYSCQYGTFLLDCDRQRKHANITEHTISLWYHIMSLKPKYTNPSYAASNEVLCPIINKLTVTLWNDYYLRWNPFANDDKQVEETIKQRMLMRQVSLTELRASFISLEVDDSRVRSESLAVPHVRSFKDLSRSKLKKEDETKKGFPEMKKISTSAPSTIRDDVEHKEKATTTTTTTTTTVTTTTLPPMERRETSSGKGIKLSPLKDSADDGHTKEKKQKKKAKKDKEKKVRSSTKSAADGRNSDSSAEHAVSSSSPTNGGAEHQTPPPTKNKDKKKQKKKESLTNSSVTSTEIPPTQEQPPNQSS